MEVDKVNLCKPFLSEILLSTSVYTVTLIRTKVYYNTKLNIFQSLLWLVVNFKTVSKYLLLMILSNYLSRPIMLVLVSFQRFFIRTIVPISSLSPFFCSSKAPANVIFKNTCLLVLLLEIEAKNERTTTNSGLEKIFLNGRLVCLIVHPQVLVYPRLVVHPQVIS